METNLIINAVNEGYSTTQVNSTMTVGELMDYLSQFEEGTKVYLSFDNGYTYGGIKDDNFSDEEVEEENLEECHEETEE